MITTRLRQRKIGAPAAAGTPGRPKVVVVGAGFGGLAAVEELSKLSADVTLVDRHNFATFQPLLYQVATAGLNPGDVAFPIRTVIRSMARTKFEQGELASVDAERKFIVLEDGRTIDYDYLILAVGATANYFGIEGAREYSHAIYTLDDALDVRNHLFHQFEQAVAHGVRDGALTFVVVGGGATGVELAGAIAELAHKALYTDYTSLNPDDVKVILIEQQTRLLEAFNEELSEYARRELRTRGVTVLLQEAVQAVEPGVILLHSGREIQNGLVLWAAGVAVPPVIGRLGLPTGRGGRLMVGGDLRVLGSESIFAIGDVALASDPAGTPLPQLAQPAIQGGRHAARQIGSLAKEEATYPFRYRDKGTMATIGRRAAVAEVGRGIRLSGTAAWLAWLGLHVVTLLGSRNKASVMINWTWHYLSWGKGPRVILGG
ncbi:NAD(P)/FAD-dependent oxidoreductase [Ferrimicrobium sp.]|uniref:NAD(P)/FAD-dependent oxidoreductase n=1 Tax=Ferrimicrobium sp. TaxID=2926050 RepID=UPI00260798EF|nr:NAD(P)/FAD-dependent oxidoreductase [Ferrimicrobium sp.]